MAITYKGRIREKASKIVSVWEKEYGPFSNETKRMLIDEVADVLDDGWLRFMIWIVGLILAPAFIGILIIVLYEMKYRKEWKAEKIKRIEENIATKKVAIETLI